MHAIRINRYTIFDIRDGLGITADEVVEASSPLDAVKVLYLDAARDYTNTGNIVVRGAHGSYVFNGKRRRSNEDVL